MVRGGCRLQDAGFEQVYPVPPPARAPRDLLDLQKVTQKEKENRNDELGSELSQAPKEAGNVNPDLPPNHKAPRKPEAYLQTEAGALMSTLADGS